MSGLRTILTGTTNVRVRFLCVIIYYGMTLTCSELHRTMYNTSTPAQCIILHIALSNRPIHQQTTIHIGTLRGCDNCLGSYYSAVHRHTDLSTAQSRDNLKLSLQIQHSYILCNT